MLLLANCNSLARKLQAYVLTLDSRLVLGRRDAILITRLIVQPREAVWRDCHGATTGCHRSRHRAGLAAGPVAAPPGSRGGRGGFVREVGLPSAAAINMTQMVGIGPFITIPLVVAAMGGPQAVIGWIAGAVLALADGLVWAELGAAMPGAGGTYIYLREAFQYRTGRLMPLLFVWTAELFIPLIMSTGVMGLVQYLGFFQPHMSYWEGRA